MRCRRAQHLISELLDGELREKDRRQLKEHLDYCEKCHSLYEDLSIIKSSLVSTDSLEPSGRVWEKLKSRLESELLPRLQAETSGRSEVKPARKIFRWFQIPEATLRYAAVFFVVFVFVVGAFYFGRYYQKTEKTEIQMASQNPALQKIQEAEFYYRKAIQSLTQALESSENGLPPEMVEVLQANLSLLDRTIELCQQAVNDQPDNLQVRDYLLSAYSSKLNFMNRMLEAKQSFASPGSESL
jgi:hypothetical protein